MPDPTALGMDVGLIDKSDAAKLVVELEEFSTMLRSPILRFERDNHEP